MDRLDTAVANAFDNFDLDKSGFIEAEEFRKLCLSLGVELEGYELQRAITLLDKDGSGGKIDKKDFIDWWENRGEDLDGDGKLDAVEKKLSKVQHSGFEKAITFMLNSLHEDHLAVSREVTSLEERKAGIQKMLDNLASELGLKNKALAQLYSEKEKCDQVILEVEGAYCSIMEASQSLLHTTRSLGTRLDSKFPGREILNDDTLHAIQYDHYERNRAPPSVMMSTTSPSLPPPSDLTAEGRALHESGFAPSPSKHGR